MSGFAREILPISVETELKNSYLEYAMSVLVGRALPDARDGLKPVHRRILFAMHELGNDYNKAYKKSARIVGDVIAKYHPHGDVAIYDSLVRMAQTFSLRYVLVDGQGNFGSIDGDAPAAMRYTEARMAKMTHSLLADLEKETVDFVANYDGNEREPTVLPTRIPNLLANGSSGIAVGMATNMPPHNLGELIDACIALIDNPELSFEELIAIIPGPDFPTAGIINGRAGIIEAYRTGRGRIRIRAKVHVEEDEGNGKPSIIITELPYQVNKARLVERIAELVKEKIVEGITHLRDESDREGMRVVVELRRGENAEVMINKLYTNTQLEVVYGINNVALLDGQPQTLNLRQLLDAFLRHRREVVTRRSIFELRKARERAHILEGLAVALSNIDKMITIIKASPTANEAKEKLMAEVWEAGLVQALIEKAGKDAHTSRPEDLAVNLGMQTTGYYLSPAQANAILEMRLQRLTGLEQEKIVEEYQNLLIEIAKLLNVLSDPVRLMTVIKDELAEVKKEFADSRKTVITESEEDLSIEDLIPQEDRVITLSHEGYIKTQPVSAYQAQRRGGKGKSAAATKEEDFIEALWVANTHDMLLCFSNIGKVYWLKVYQLPDASRASRGRPIVNILNLQENEKITAVLPVKEFDDKHFVFMATSTGTVKKTALSEFSRPRSTGIIAIDLEEHEVLIGADLTDGTRDVMLFSDAGKVIRFPEEKVRQMGRGAHGVRGMMLQDNQKLISLVVVKEGGAILTATENGYGKRTELEDYRITGRGGQGVISIQVSERNGLVVAAKEVQESDEVFLISDAGTMVRTRVSEISCVGRNTQGVRLINLAESEKLVSLEKVADAGEEAAVEEAVVGEPEA
jgi:DNA gyrase subunit A